jgi:D-glycero-D-manno-heptose 1,7-bisphosphate phosphatase
MISVFRSPVIQSKKALFFDRDNTLSFDAGYTYKLGDLELMPWARQIVKWGREHGYTLCLITNQSGIGRGYYSSEEAFEFIFALEQAIGEQFDAICMCPHLQSDECDCRKPKPGMIGACIIQYGLDPTKCIFIGDRLDDMLAARSAGVPGLRISDEICTSYTSCKDLLEAQVYLETRV